MSERPRLSVCRGFKALKQIVKLRYKLGQTKEMLESYRCALAP